MNNAPSSHTRSLASYHPSAFLLTAQLLSLALYAAFEGSSGGRAVIATFGVMILALAVWVIKRSPTIRWLTWMFAAPALALSLLSALLQTPTLLMWSSLVEAVLYFYAAGSLIAYMMEDDQVTTDELFAAGGTFTVLAWGFAHAYLACQIWLPGSFSGGTSPQTFLELLFLSFANLSATGLSDILPVTPPARVLVMLEQFAGVAYIAVVVSRLIGMTVMRRN